MELPNITKIEPRWNLNLSNSPDIVVHLDSELSSLNWRYEKINLKPEDPTKHFWLISRNLFPWVRFVHVDEPDGNPSYHGALGGNYTLTDGSVYHTNTGWSSREGVYNRDFVVSIPDEVTQVTVRIPKWDIGFAGYYINADYLATHLMFPSDLYLVRHKQFTNEIYHTISTSPDEVTKPTT